MKPPENPAHAWFRLILWFLPGICSFSTLVVVEKFGSPIVIPAAVVVDLAFVIGAGWFSATLCTHTRYEFHGILYFIVKFFCLQLVIIPLTMASLIPFANMMGLLP